MPKRVPLWNGEKVTIDRNSLRGVVTRSAESQENVRSSSGAFQTHLRRDRRPGPAPDGVLHCINSFHSTNNKLAMAVESDHMYSECADSKASLRRDVEVLKLKEFLLLHLDLVQQQSEQLQEKDKIIRELKAENKILKQRLERIDRRVSLSQQKRGNEGSPVSEVITSIKDENDNSGALKVDIPATKPLSKQSSKVSPQRSPRDDVSATKVIKQESPPHSRGSKDQYHKPLPKCSLPREKRQRRDTDVSTLGSDTENVEVEIKQDLPLLKSLPDTPKRVVPVNKRKIDGDCDSAPKVMRSSGAKDKHERFVDADGVTDHNLRPRDKLKDAGVESAKKDCNFSSPRKSIAWSADDLEKPPNKGLALATKKLKQRLHVKEEYSMGPTLRTRKGLPPEGRLVRGEKVLSTSSVYFLPSDNSPPDLSITPYEDASQLDIEIPRWRTRVLTSLYVMEGTENLEDEIFNKRHSRFEQDERRRKRWDFQRMRAQRLYEKLKERYEGRHNLNEPDSPGHKSLWPHAESAVYIHVDDKLPVCAFGHPLAEISSCEFSLPWLSSRSHNGVSTRQRRR